MALKALMLRRNIEAKAAELEALQQQDPDFEARETSLMASIDEAVSAEERSAVEAEIDRYDADLRAHQEAVASASADLEQLRAQLAEIEASKPAAPISADKNNERKTVTMFESQCNIRALPMRQRAFEAAFTRQERKDIVAQDDVQNFFAELRSLSKVKASVTGGELTIPVVFLDLISENMYRYSKLLNRVRVRQVRGQARQTIAGTVPEAVWTEMCGALNELTFNFNQVTLDGYKVGGFVPVCNALLEDSDIALASWLVEMMSESIGLAMDAAILYGTGTGMPMGIVTRLAQSSKPAGYPANAPAWTDLHTSNIKSLSSSLTGAAFWAALTEAAGATFTKYSRGNQFWAMNSKTYNKLKSKVITFTATGDIVANIFGYLPVITGDVDILEFIPDDDIIGGYGDLYLLAQREGITIGADETGRTNRVLDETLFFGKARADGCPIIAGAFVAINIGGSSVTTTHSFPGDTANNADLASLSIGETLSPTFDADVTSYTATASNASDAVTAIADDPDAQVAIEYNGSNVLNGSTISWATGTKNLVVTVKKGTAVKVYTVAVTKN
jgi:HK97 family phage major capsid protein